MNPSSDAEGPRRSWRRKALHLSSLYIPVSYGFLSRETALAILVPITLLFVFLDGFRLFHRGWNRFVASLVRGFMKEGEEGRLSGSSYFLLGCALSIGLFSKPIAILSILVMILSDTLAFWIGTRFGQRKVFGKTLEGSLSFFGSATLLGIAFPGVPVFSAILGALAATLVELLPTGVDDNLTIPIAAGGIMTALS